MGESPNPCRNHSVDRIRIAAMQREGTLFNRTRLRAALWFDSLPSSLCQGEEQDFSADTGHLSLHSTMSKT